MRIRKLAIAALIATVPTATAFAQGALDQSVPRVSPTTAAARQSYDTVADKPVKNGDTRTRNCDHSRGDTRTPTCDRSLRLRCR